MDGNENYYDIEVYEAHGKVQLVPVQFSGFFKIDLFVKIDILLWIDKPYEDYEVIVCDKQLRLF